MGALLCEREPITKGSNAMNQANEGLWITPAQLAIRDKWEQALKLNNCTLQMALTGVLQAGVPAGDYLIECVERAFINYTTGALLAEGEKMPANLAAAFGAQKLGNQAQASRAQQLARDVYECVMEFHLRHPKGTAEHLSLSRTTPERKKANETAFSAAARSFGVPEATVVNCYARHLRSLSDDVKG